MTYTDKNILTEAVKKSRRIALNMIKANLDILSIMEESKLHREEIINLRNFFELSLMAMIKKLESMNFTYSNFFIFLVYFIY